jgi:hypothetical protein
VNQETLDQLIGPVPPSTIDVGGVIRRTRRRRRIRRALAGCATATAVLAVVAAGAVLVDGSKRAPVVNPPQVAASVPATPSQRPPSTDFVLNTSTRAGQELALDRLRNALEEATAEYAPGTKWIYMPDEPGEPRTPDGRPILLYTVADDTFRGRSGVTAGGRKGGFYLTLRPTACEAGQGCQPMHRCSDGGIDCVTSRTSGGLRIVSFVEKPGKKLLFYSVDVEITGGYALHLEAVNYFGGDGSAAVAATPVFSRVQLEGIATTIADRIAA